MSRAKPTFLRAGLAGGGGENGQTKILRGLRVVELATVIAAPCACALLCDFGAEVIKMENPSNPDIARGWGRHDSAEKTGDPALRSAILPKNGGGGSAFIQLNRGKKSLTLDISKPEGKLILRKAIASADIFVTNVRQKSLEKMGIDYDSLRAKHPRLIYGQLSAWGRDGPKKNDPGYDFAAFWAHTGIMDLIRSSDEADMPRFPGGVGDYTTGCQMFGGILGALYHRERTGEGQLVDAALMRSGIWFLAHVIVQGVGGNTWALEGSGSKKVPTGSVRETTKLGARRTGITDQPFKCSDGVWLYLLGLEQRRHMPATLRALGLKPEDIFGSSKRPTKDIDWRAATALVDKVFLTRTSQEWGEVFDFHGVWWTKVNRFNVIHEDEQANAAKTFVSVPGVRHKVIANPVILSKADANPESSAPVFGANNEEVLADLGYSDIDIDDLRRKKVI